MDKYASFAELSGSQRLNVDYRIRCVERSRSYAVIAPHGGSIEPGTSEIAEAIAGKELSFYAFEGRKENGNADLHITSTMFDEPQCVTMVKKVETVVALHGRALDSKIVYLGGLDTVLLKRIEHALLKAGISASANDDPQFQGLSKMNICNRGRAGRGVQLELTRGLRLDMFSGLDTTSREIRKPLFEKFVSAIRSALI